MPSTGPLTAGARPRFAWPAPAPSRRELVIAAMATALSMVVVLMWSTDRWYFIDDWDFLLARSLDDVGSLLAPHSGHLQLPVGFVYQLVFEGAGFDYWPWFVIPRILGYGAMTYVMWIVLRRRGADPVVSWIALGGLLFLGSSAFLNAATIGHHLVFPALALAASMYVAGGPRRTWGDQLIFAALALVMVVSTSSGIAAVAALGIVGVCLGRFRTVAPPLAPVVVAYLAWLVANPGGGTTTLGLDTLLAVPGTMWEMVAPTAARTLALPSTLGPVLVVLLVGVLVVWALRDRLGPFEAVWLLATVIWMTMIIVARVVPGPVSPGAVRYGYLITWFLVPAIVPHLRLSNRTWLRWVTVGAAVLIVVGNVVATQGRAGGLGIHDLRGARSYPGGGHPRRRGRTGRRYQPPLRRSSFRAEGLHRGVGEAAATDRRLGAGSHRLPRPTSRWRGG